MIDYSAQKKKFNDPKGAKYFIPVEGGIINLFGPSHSLSLICNPILTKKNCLINIGKIYMQIPCR